MTVTVLLAAIQILTCKQPTATVNLAVGIQFIIYFILDQNPMAMSIIFPTKSNQYIILKGNNLIPTQNCNLIN